MITLVSKDAGTLLKQWMCCGGEPEIRPGKVSKRSGKGQEKVREGFYLNKQVVGTGFHSKFTNISQNHRCCLISFFRMLRYYFK